MLNAEGRLSDGVHPMTLAAVSAVFGWNRCRRELIAAMTAAFADLNALGCEVVWLDGSFVTDKPEPGDYDAVFEHRTMDLSAARLALPELFDRAPQRPAMKARFKGDLLPNVLEAASQQLFIDFFQQDKERPGHTKGIVTINLASEFKP
jgi:hypothetical protein